MERREEGHGRDRADPQPARLSDGTSAAGPGGADGGYALRINAAMTAERLIALRPADQARHNPAAAGR